MPPVASPFLSSPPKVSVVSCPFSGGQPKDGVDTGSIHLVEAGLLDDIKNLGYQVNFEGHDAIDMAALSDDPPIGKMRNPRLVSKANKSLAEKIEKYNKQGHLVLTLGGDHSLALGTVSGTFKQYPDACLIWVDAHADINTPLSTPSGNLHGCPVSFLMGLEGTDVDEFSWVKPILDAKRLVYIGLRDLDEYEKTIIKEKEITAFTMYHVDKYGIGKVVEMALDAVNEKRDRPIHMSFDVDALDPTVAPSTGTPVRGGLTFREGHYICEAVAETGLLVSLDIMEVNPSLENKNSVTQTVNIGRSLTRSSLGETLL